MINARVHPAIFGQVGDPQAFTAGYLSTAKSVMNRYNETRLVMRSVVGRCRFLLERETLINERADHQRLKRELKPITDRVVGGNERSSGWFGVGAVWGRVRGVAVIMCHRGLIYHPYELGLHFAHRPIHVVKIAEKVMLFLWTYSFVQVNHIVP